MRNAGTVLLWGLRADPPITAVWEALKRAACPVVLLDQRLLAETEVHLEVGPNVECRVRVKEQNFDLSAVNAAYIRPCDAREFPEVAAAGQHSELWRHALALQDILLSWADLAPALVLNRPSYMAVNDSKPYQASWIESLGFRIPDTLITTDPAAALQFWKQHDRVIYKSVSGTRSIVSQLTAEHLDRFDNIASCPTQFQQYVRGTEYRVHVIGEEIFACAVLSHADDYRYSTDPVDMQSYDLPGEIAARSRTLAEAMHLTLAGIDLRRTPEGEWYCFEVNPSPAFTCFEQKTRQPMAEAVARLLTSGKYSPTPELCCA